MKKLIIAFIVLFQIFVQVNIFAQSANFQSPLVNAKESAGVFEVKYVDFGSEAGNIIIQIEFYNRINDVDTTDKSITVISSGNDHIVKEKIKNDFKEEMNHTMKMIFTQDRSFANTSAYDVYMGAYEQFYDFLAEERFKQVKYLASIIDMNSMKGYLYKRDLRKYYTLKPDKYMYIEIHCDPYSKTSFAKSDIVSVPVDYSFNVYGIIHHRCNEQEATKISKNISLGWDSTICINKDKDKEKLYINNIKDYRDIGMNTLVSIFILDGGTSVFNTGIDLTFACEKIK